MKINCNFCGYQHERSREKCPTWGKTCDNCKGRNNFKSNCKKVHAVAQFQNGIEDFDDQWLMAANYKEESINASLTVNEHDVSFQLDSASNVKTICQNHVRKHQVSPTTVRLNMWNKTNMKPLGEIVLMVVNPRTRAKSEVKFVVVPNGFTNLLGLKTIQELAGALLPVFDDALPKLKDAKVFSKLDVREAHWHVRLDEESSKLTTMITPLGRSWWKRLPFGLKVSSEIFQRKLDEALGSLDGVLIVVDDIVLAGCCQTMEPAQIDNQQKLTKTLKRFLPDLAETYEPIRAITRKNTPFVWSMECENAFDTLKRNLSQSPCLAHFDVSKEVVIQVDRSKHGIGAVLLEEGRPVEYASRALTPSERNWAQIGKEALSVLFGLERFD
ncbi:Enzymatic polyprotein [Acropora cervicornis]|uniref:Enzymatic polyprotein n=1 Tax=Acropora cervicornis TaxID=6130 RepID=A0AAD9PTH0_ACRCE|nr:Enzymatic polyprotein [Acropora cervicornis]